VLPTMTILPIVNKAHLAGGGDGGGDGKGNGVKKTALDKFAEEMAYAGAIANQQFDADTHRPDSQRYGIPGGKNVNGPNSPAAQATAGGVLVVVAVLSAAGFEKKLKAAFAKKAPIPIEDMARVGKETVEDLVKSAAKELQQTSLKRSGKALAEEVALKDARQAVAEMLNQTKTIGPYEAMQRFTQKLGSEYQAHHILEKSMVEKFKLGDPDKVPSVILSAVEHKKLTAELASKTPKAETLQELWEAYKNAYEDYPNWLEAIKPYFTKGK
jgi:hypothetical protein